MNIDQLNYFIWKMAHHLVTREGFFLVNNDDGTLTLRKSEGFLTTYLWLIPGDRLSTQRIKRELDDSLTWMSAYRRRTPSFFHKSIHLYLFTEPKEDSFLKSISNLSTFSLTGKYHSLAWAADIKNGRFYARNTFLPITKQLKTNLSRITHQVFGEGVPYGEQLAKQISHWQGKMQDSQFQTERSYKRFIRIGKGAPFTFTFAGINLLVWIMMTIYGGSSNPETLIRFGAKYNPYIDQGEYWRLVAPIFLHIGGFHLWFNSTALLALGGHVERIYGSIRFLMIYLFSGIVGAFSSYLFSPHISAGASGAIFGLFGALLFFSLRKPNIFGHTMGPGLISGLGVNLLLGFVIPGIDNYAHLGGLIGGFLIAFLVRIPRREYQIEQ